MTVSTFINIRVPSGIVIGTFRVGYDFPIFSCMRSIRKILPYKIEK